MTPGEIVRRVLGGRIFMRVVAVYRAVFVDLDEVAACIPSLPAGAEVLDVGGGDGALLERLLRRQSGLLATLVDRRAEVGLCLSPASRARVRLLPSSSVADCARAGVPVPDLVLVADVLHHVPPPSREAFLRDIRDLVGTRPFRLVVKEVAPRGWRATLGLLSDRFVTGDRGVALLTPDELKRMVAAVFPDLVPRDTALLSRDFPNYCLVFEPLTDRAASGGPKSR